MRFQLLTVALSMVLFGFETSAQTARLDAEALWKQLSQNIEYRRASGWLSDSEIQQINKMSKSSPQYLKARDQALDRFLRNYSSDLKAHQLNPNRVLPTVEAVDKIKTQKFDVSPKALNRVYKEVQPSLSNKEIVSWGRAKLSGETPRLRFRGAGLFSVADLGLLVIEGVNDARSKALQAELASDAENGTCKQDPSDAYAKAFTFLDLSDQDRMLESCHPVDRVRPTQLTAKVRAVREDLQRKFSTGQAHCVYENGKPVIHTVSDAGTKQDILFTQEGSFERLRILPQGRAGGRPSKFEGSYLEYSNFPAPQSVTYYAVTKNAQKETGPDLNSAHMKAEPLNSFSARVFCVTQGCSQDTPEFLAIQQDEMLVTTPSEPFGRITPNKEFLTDSARALAEFRLGLEENHPVTPNFRNICLSLGSVPPKAPTIQEHLPEKAAPSEGAGPSHSAR